MSERRLPVVAVIGRPNVGKSTLVNRLAEIRSSIVGPMSGLTRDRLDVDASWRGRGFTLSDTGGLIEAALGADSTATITGKVASKALAAAERADLVLFVLDARDGVTADELALVERLRRVKPAVIVVANKVDAAEQEADVAEMWSLGLGEPMMVSASQGRGSGELLDRIVEMLPEAPEIDVPPMPAIALVGRPNVGKSSLFNRLVGEERAIVHFEPGTTRDSIDTTVEIDGRSMRFIDTAGIRRYAKTEGVEIYSASRTRAAIERADLAILVVDASEGATSMDQRIAKQVGEAGVAAIVALNKWDLIEDETHALSVERSMSDRLHFLAHAPMVRTSATSQRGLTKLLDRFDPVLRDRNFRVPTGELNRLIQAAQQKTPAPRSGNKLARILYATQAQAAPPTFVLFSTAPLAEAWLRFIERRLREEFGFEGNPIRLIVRERQRDLR